ncbi:hypothetical protein IQ255_07715 [Pleurocapsales cyanobacterium LEGE 10410]|nr:hypothetical protein [Pleurocapsales cyanobacterium LEGE 10410]
MTYKPDTNKLLGHLICESINKKEPQLEEAVKKLSKEHPVFDTAVLAVHAILQTILITPSDLLGEGVVTASAKTKADRLYILANINSVWNSIPVTQSFALVLSTFGGASIPAAIALGVLCNTIQIHSYKNALIDFTNPDVHHSKQPIWKKILRSPGMMTVIAANSLLTPLAFPVSIALTSPAALAESGAKRELHKIEESMDSYVAMREKEINLLAREKHCEQSLREIIKLGNDPKTAQSNGRNAIILKDFGNDLTGDYAPGSTCNLVKVDRRNIEEASSKIGENLLQSKQAASERGLTALGQLKEFYPEIYDATFSQDGSIKDPLKSFELSLLFAAQALLQGRIGILLFPTIMLLLSISLSVASVQFVFTLAKDPDIRMSFDPGCKKLLDSLLAQEQEALLNEIKLTEKTNEHN